VIPVGKVAEHDRKKGIYWYLGDEGQNRCPRVHIKEDPEWFAALLTAHNAYQLGHLTHAGGLDRQPCLFIPLMSVITEQLNREKEYEASTRQGVIDAVEQSKKQ
jgi:hypothetical protein